MTMSPYLQRIRSLVGNELVVLPSVTILAFDSAGHVLLAKHRDTNAEPQRSWNDDDEAETRQTEPEEAGAAGVEAAADAARRLAAGSR
jgi:hypothetical protein